MQTSLLIGPSASRAFVNEEKYAEIWHAVCEYSGNWVKPNISWVLSNEDTVIQANTEFKSSGIKVDVNSTFEFQLSQFEGKYLTCLIQNKFGRDERLMVHVPKYCKLSQLSQQKRKQQQKNVFYLLIAICCFFHSAISSIEVLNKTTLDRRSHGRHEHRLALQENLSNQKILLKAYGNAPSHKTTCYRYVESWMLK